MRRDRWAGGRRSASGLGLWALLACATTPVATWEEREGSPTGAPEEAAPVATSKLSAADLARSVASADKCLRLAETHDIKSARKGWTLLQACARRPDFVDLEAVLSKPWLKRAQTTAEGPRLLAHVVAHRGGRVMRDLDRIQARGVPVLSLDQATATNTPQGTQVLLRGRIVEVKGEGKDWLVVVDEADFISELAAVAEAQTKQPPPAQGDDEDKASDEADDDGDLGGALDPSDPDEPEPAADTDEELTLRRTGRRVLVQAGALEPGVKAGLASVLLMTYRGTQPCAGPADRSIKQCAGGWLSELLVTSADD